MFVMLPPVRTSSVHERQVATTIKRRKIPIKDKFGSLFNTSSLTERKTITATTAAAAATVPVLVPALALATEANTVAAANTSISHTNFCINCNNTTTTIINNNCNIIDINKINNNQSYCCCNSNLNINNLKLNINNNYNRINSNSNNNTITTIITSTTTTTTTTNTTTTSNVNRHYSYNNNNNNNNNNSITNIDDTTTTTSTGCIRTLGNCRKRFFIRKIIQLNKEKSLETKENIRFAIENNNQQYINNSNNNNNNFNQNNNTNNRKLTLFKPITTTTTRKSKPNFTLGELNNFRKTTNLQAPPVATILNDLSPVPSTTKVKNRKSTFPMSLMTPKGLPSDTPDVKAMRYYRLWIYTCNAVLLMAVIIFCGVAGKVLVADYRRLLINGLNLGQPNFIYAYLALIVQSGFLQLIGCLGALRLSEKLLNAYWLLLLVLLIGDAILGIFWMFKFDRIIQELQPILRYRLATEYGNSIEFSDLWDRLQTESRCCGVIGPQDFSTLSVNRSYPTSCCTSADVIEQISVSKRPLASPVVFRNDELTNAQQKSNLTDITDTAWSHVISENREEEKTISVCKAVFQQGCIDRLTTWLRNTADILFVLGYCVIAFLKLCFLGILRYEIKEMIQKIKLLQNEMAAAILEPEIGEQHVTQQTTNTTINNGGLHTEPKVGNRDRERSRMSSGESERESLLIHENPPQHPRQQHLRNKHLYGCTEGGGGGAGGAHGGGESDSNSNCALIVEDSGAAAVAAAKALNSNNNYELSEFETRGPTYRPMNAPSVTRI